MPSSTIDKWLIGRRQFLKGMLWFCVLSQVPYLVTSCENKSESSNLTDFQIKELDAILQTLLPNDGIGPDAHDIHGLEYIQWTLKDPLLKVDGKNFIIEGIDKISEGSFEEFKTDFANLQQSKRKFLIQKIIELDWAEKWVSVMLSLLLEAMLSAPLYGFNQEAIAWKWLQHKGGIPAPKPEYLFPQVLKKYPSLHG